MTDTGFGSDLLPFAPAPLQCSAKLGVKVQLVHVQPPSVAKFCTSYSQHFAESKRNTLRVQRKPIVQVVSEALKWHMERQGLSQLELGTRAKVAPNTVGNFINPKKRADSVSGKQPSGKLTELEMIARAMGLEVSDLVVDMSPAAREERHRVTLAMKLLSGQASPADVESGEHSSETAERSQSGRRAA